jgi:hypothetical protein
MLFTLIVLLTACDRSTAPAARATAAVTPTLSRSDIAPGPQLAWRQAYAPAEGDATTTAVALQTLVVAPSDGDVVYLCVAPSEEETNAQISVSRDRGQSWARGGAIPVGAPPSASGAELACRIVVDATRPDTAVVETNWYERGGGHEPISSYASVDYGAHWRRLVSPLISTGLASDGGAIFAAGSAPGPQGRSESGLWVSHDQLQSWQALPLPTDVVFSAFWLNPFTGALLLAARTQDGGNARLFRSAGGGAWIDWIVQPPQTLQSAAPWRVCGATTLLDDHAQPQLNTLTCSNDGGQSWTARPALNLTQQTAKGLKALVPSGVFALTSDGAALAMTGARSSHLYRLPADGAAWQDLGPAPTDEFQSRAYAPTATSGALWLIDPPRLFTAPYPLA